MIADFLKTLFDLLIVVILTIPLYAIFLGKKSLRHSIMPISTGIKAAPLGCLAFFILTIFLGTINYLFLAVLLAVGLALVCTMTVFFHKKALAWNHSHPSENSVPLTESETKPHFKWGIFGFAGMLIATYILSLLLFPLFIFGCNLNTYDIFFKPVAIPVHAALGAKTTVRLTERPLPALAYESAFMLILDDHAGNRKEFPDFIINYGGGAEIAVYRIAGQSENKQGWLLFSNGISSACLDLDSRELKTQDGIDRFPCQFIGIYKRRTLDTNAIDPKWQPKLKP